MAEAPIHQVVVVAASPDQVLHQVMSISGADKYTPVMHSAEGVVLQRKKIPVWAVVVAALVPLVGLLALFAREEETVGITIEPVPDGTQVTVKGEASRVLQSALQYVLSGQQATLAGLPQNVYASPGAAPWAPPPPPSA